MTEPLTADTPPSRPFARAGRDVVEGVILRLSLLPARVDRGPIQAALAGALSALGRLERTPIDDLAHLDLLRAAVSAVGQARSLTSAAEATTGSAPDLSKSLLDVENALTSAVEPTIAIIVAMQDRLLRMGKMPAPEAPKLTPFRVCGGAPHVFTLERDPLPPFLDTAHSRARSRAADAPRTEAAGSDTDSPQTHLAAPHAPEFGSEDAFLDGVPAGGSLFGEDESEAAGASRLLRDVMEEIGSLGMLRAPGGPPVAWGVGLAEFEERLLRDVDAFMALASPKDEGTPRVDALGRLLFWAGDAMVPDPVRAFARTFLLGCVAGEDTARAAVMAVRRSHPITHEAERDALALSPHPDIGRELSRLFADETPEVLTLAAEVIRRRREVSLEVVAPLLSHPRATVRRAAARALSVSSSPQAALRLLEEHASAEEDDDALLGAAESLLVLGSRKGLGLVRDRLQEEAENAGSLSRQVRTAALRLLSLSGGRADGALLGRLLRRDPAAATALGFHGDAASIPLLLQEMRETAGHPKHHSFARAAAAALHRITALGRPQSDDGRTSMYVVEAPTDHSLWTTRLETAGDRFTRPLRYRFGRPWTPLAVISEAQTNEVITDVQRDLLMELSIASRGASRADPDGFIAHRRAALGELVQRFSSARWPEGQWPAGLLFEG